MVRTGADEQVWARRKFSCGKNDNAFEIEAHVIRLAVVLNDSICVALSGGFLSAASSKASRGRVLVFDYTQTVHIGYLLPSSQTTMFQYVLPSEQLY